MKSWLWAFTAAALITLASANQAPLFSPTISPVSGLQLTNNFNSGLDAINTCNSGNTAPANQLAASPSAGNCWLDTSLTPYKWKIYDGAQWVTVAFLDQTNHYWTPVIGGGIVNSIASAATLDLCGVAPAFSSITGVVTITSFGSSCTTGQIKFGVFTGVLTLTHNAASLILPFNGSNITTAAGDIFQAVYLGGGNWRVLNYQKATGAPSIPTPTQQVLITGTGLTYTPTAGAVHIKVRMIGGGGGGGAQVTNAGSAGGTTSFNGITAIGGGGGATAAVAGRTGGIGGTGGAGTAALRAPGSPGGTGTAAGGTVGGGHGAAGIFGGGAGQSAPQGGSAGGGNAVANSGAGGGGTNNGTNGSGAGGSGEYVELAYLPATTYTYTVGASGAGGPAGSLKGGDGGSGIIIIDEIYY